MEHPTIEQEIERKSLEELERIYHGIKTRSISVFDGAAALNTLWNTVSGLVPKETMDTISQVANVIIQAAQKQRRPHAVTVLVSQAVTVVLVLYQERLDMISGDARVKTFQPSPEVVHAGVWVEDKFKELTAALEARGYKKVFE